MENTKKDVQHEKIAKKGARIMIAAPQSGSGKTLITCALLQALKEKNYHLESFKCGPDYIDPMFHKTVLGISSRNLDPFFTEDSITRMLLSKGQDSRDLAVIEGVMGLYDGLGGIREEASSYALAKATNTPILLTVNARGIGRSLLALLSGFLQYDTAHLIKGVILNQTPSSFASVLAKEIEETFHIPVVASFPVRDDVRIESRHLGLVMPYELEDIQSRLKIASQVLCENANIEQILEIAKSAPKLEYDVESDIKHKITEKTIRIGVARDEAFCFYYEDNLRLLEKCGAKLQYFSPLHDTRLPKDCDAMLLGGGYPELYAKELSKNVSMLNAIKKAFRAGMPTVAECGGFMYLHTYIRNICDDNDEKNNADTQNNTDIQNDMNKSKLVGALDGGCHFKGKLVRFGYIELAEKHSNFLPLNEKIKAHEFHYYDSTDNGADCIATKPATGRSYDCVISHDNYWLGFPHLYYPSNPHFAESLVRKAYEYRRNKNGKLL